MNSRLLGNNQVLSIAHWKTLLPGRRSNGELSGCGRRGGHSTWRHCLTWKLAWKGISPRLGCRGRGHGGSRNLPGSSSPRRLWNLGISIQMSWRGDCVTIGLGSSHRRSAALVPTGLGRGQAGPKTACSKDHVGQPGLFHRVDSDQANSNGKQGRQNPGSQLDRSALQTANQFQQLRSQSSEESTELASKAQAAANRDHQWRHKPNNRSNFCDRHHLPAPPLEESVQVFPPPAKLPMRLSRDLSEKSGQRRPDATEKNSGLQCHSPTEESRLSSSPALRLGNFRARFPLGRQGQSRQLACETSKREICQATKRCNWRGDCWLTWRNSLGTSWF